MIRRMSGMVRLVGARNYEETALGRAPGGAQDRFSCSLGNLLLGNLRVAGALECAMAPARLLVEEDCRMVVGGAPLDLRVAGGLRRRWEVLSVSAGSVVELRPTGMGCRSYVCVAGGLCDGEGKLGEQWLFSENGGVSRAKPGARPMLWDRRWEPGPGQLRLLPGPEFSEVAALGLSTGRWVVSRQSSGMGVILEGGSLGLEHYDLLSAPVQDGTVQATAGGLVALLRERGTLGGYPRVATVIDCDVDRLAQMLPGDRVRFSMVNREAAVRLCWLQEEALRRALGG